MGGEGLQRDGEEEHRVYLDVEELQQVGERMKKRERVWAVVEELQRGGEEGGQVWLLEH